MSDLPDLYSKLPLFVQYSAAGLAAYGAFWSLIKNAPIPWRNTMSKRWPWAWRDNWVPECTQLEDEDKNDNHFRNPYRAIFGKIGERWSNKAPQTVGEWYSVTFSKELVINRVQMPPHERDGDPAKTEIQVLNPDGKSWKPIRTCLGTIDVRFCSPITTKGVRAVIREPRMRPDGKPYGWSITDVKISEVLLPWLCKRWTRTLQKQRIV